jgi:Fe2+ transport system protein B
MKRSLPKDEEARMADPLYPDPERSRYELAALISLLAAYGALTVYVLLFADSIPTNRGAQILSIWAVLQFFVPILLAWISNLLAARGFPRR